MSKVVLSDNNEVVITPDGYLLSEPYNFGLGFAAPADKGLQVKFSAQTTLSLLFWVRTNGFYSPSMYITCADGTQYNVIFYTGNLIRIFGGDIPGGYFDFGNYAGNGNTLSMYMFTLSDGYLKVFSNENQYGNILNFPDHGGIKQFDFFTTNAATYWKMTYISIYSRLVDLDEYEYIYFNKAGNEPRNPTNMIGYIKTDSCEVLDFSAAHDNSDLGAGFNDLSLNRTYARVLSLPAGTPAEQADYVNNNYLSSIANGN